MSRHRHFTNAADELHVAQSALSHQVRRLEQELGVELLRRTTRTVQPTEAGELVAARARAIEQEIDALKTEIDQLRGLERGHVRVGAMLFGGALDIPATLARFTSAFPGIEVQLHEGTAQQMLQMLRAGSLDVSFALESEPPGDIQRRELSNEEFALASGLSHELAGEGPISIKRLAGRRLIAFQHGATTRRLVDEALADAGVEALMALESNDLALVRALVAQGVGVAVLPRSFLERPGPRISVRPLRPALRTPVVLWWRGDRRLSPAVRTFVDFATAQRRDDRRR